MEHKARDHGVHMHHCNQGEYEGSCKYGQDDTCPALKYNLKALGKVGKKEPEEKCPALKKYPPKDPKKLTDPEIELALAECCIQCNQSEQGKAALAWMKKQAKVLDPSVPDDAKPLILARIISSRIKRNCENCCYTCSNKQLNSAIKGKNVQNQH